MKTILVKFKFDLKIHSNFNKNFKIAKFLQFSKSKGAKNSHQVIIFQQINEGKLFIGALEL